MTVTSYIPWRAFNEFHVKFYPILMKDNCQAPTQLQPQTPELELGPIFGFHHHPPTSPYYFSELQYQVN